MRFLIALALAAPVAMAQEPLPLKKAMKPNTTYTADGFIYIKSNNKLTCPPGVKIVSEKWAVLVVDGAFIAAGTAEAPVTFDKVTIRPGHKFRTIKLAHTRFTGDSGVATATRDSMGDYDRSRARGPLVMEDVAFLDTSSLDVLFHFGSISATRVSSVARMSIDAWHPSANVRADFESCFQNKAKVSGLQGGLSIANVRDVRVRFTRIAGDLTKFSNCSNLLLEGCKIQTGRFLIGRSKDTNFKKTKVLRCDLYGKTLYFTGPQNAKDRITLKECFFNGDANTKPAEIVKKRIGGMGGKIKVVVKSPAAKPHNLAGSD